MIYKTELGNTYSPIEVPIYDELGRNIGTAKVNEGKAELTITQSSELIEKLVEVNLLRTKSVSCRVINYEEFINR